MESEFQADAEAAAVAVGSDCSVDVMITTKTTDTTSDAATDPTCGTQTPAPSTDSDTSQKINPRLLSDEHWQR